MPGRFFIDLCYPAAHLLPREAFPLFGHIPPETFNVAFFIHAVNGRSNTLNRGRANITDHIVGYDLGKSSDVRHDDGQAKICRQSASPRFA